MRTRHQQTILTNNRRPDNALMYLDELADTRTITNDNTIRTMRRLQAILDHLQGQSNNQLEAKKRKLDQAFLWARSLEFAAGAGLLGLLISSGLMYQRQSKTIQTAARLIGESESETFVNDCTRCAYRFRFHYTRSHSRKKERRIFV
jgi:hypothetical protein